jgi:selenocysteine lyase/cysteine desulfurase
MEPGHQDTLNYGSLGEAIAFLEGIGMDTIETYLNGLVASAKTEFGNLGLLSEAIAERNTHSTIFNISGNAALFQRLRENNIICSMRGKGIRVSFHFYNSEDDLAKLVKVLRST